jgi:PAS domain S-box-containing protein
VTADQQGSIESLNRSARRLFGDGQAEVIGQPLRSIVAPDQGAKPEDTEVITRAAPR